MPQWSFHTLFWPCHFVCIMCGNVCVTRYVRVCVCVCAPAERHSLLITQQGTHSPVSCVNYRCCQQWVKLSWKCPRTRFFAPGFSSPPTTSCMLRTALIPTKCQAPYDTTVDLGYVAVWAMSDVNMINGHWRFPLIFFCDDRQSKVFRIWPLYATLFFFFQADLTK